MRPIVMAESTVEPIALEDAVHNLRSYSDGSTAEEALVSRLIKVARVMCEQELEMSLVAKTLQIALRSFCPDPIELPFGPVREIVSVTYRDSDGADVVMDADDYRFSAYEALPVLVPAYDASWPTARTDVDSVRIRYTVGYPSTDSPPEEVPEPIIQAMHLCIAHFYDNRGAVDADTLAELPLGARHLLAPYRQALGV